jgi:D-aminopeptidase
VLVGNAHDAALASGVTVALLEGASAVSCAVLGGAPGSRETSLLEPEMIATGRRGHRALGRIGVRARRRHRRAGLFARARHRVLVRVGDGAARAQAICFDLTNGGDKNWGRYPPYRELGYAAAEAAGESFALGTAGGGYGATTATLKAGSARRARPRPRVSASGRWSWSTRSLRR